MKCKTCNSKVKKNVQFCPYCGEGITQKEKVGKFTDITIVLDSSGSMESAKEKTIKSFNNYLLEQKQMNSDAIISLHQFNTEYETAYKNINLQKASDLTTKTYQPNGGTALLDAVGKTIGDKQHYYDSLPKNKRPKQTLVLIVTDGEENSSKEYKLSDIKKLIREKKSQGWQFGFIGAEIDAYSEASSMGIGHGQTMKINSIQDFNKGFSAASNSTMKYRATGMSFLLPQEDEDEDTK